MIMSLDSTRPGGEEPVDGGLFPAPADGSAMRDWARTLVERARNEGVALTGDEGLLATILEIETLSTGAYLAVSGIGRQVLSAS
jgi:hypothetical protein